MATIGRLNVMLGLNSSGFNSKMNQAGNRVRRFRGEVNGSASGVSALAGAMSKVALAAGAMYGALRVGRPIEAFNQAMASSTAIMGKLSASMRKDMAETARDVAFKTKFSATETAEAYYYLASAGLDASQSVAALPAVARFAQAGMFDLATATSLATDAQSALGMKAKDPAKNLENLVRVTDALVAANTLADATTQEFSEALTNKTGALLRGLGKDIEEGIGMLAAFADQGVKGADAGTQMAIVLRELQAKSMINPAVWEANGIAVHDANEEMRNFADIIEDIEKRLDGMSDKLKKQTLMQLGFSEKSVNSVQVLVGMSEKMREAEQATRDLSGITEEVADKQIPPFTKGWHQLKSAFLELVSAIGTPLLDELGVLMMSLAHTVRWVADAVSYLTDKWETWSGHAEKISWLVNLFSWYDKLEDKATTATDAIADGTDKAASKTEALNAIVNETTNAFEPAANAASDFIAAMKTENRFGGMDPDARKLLELYASGGFNNPDGSVDISKFTEAWGLVMGNLDTKIDEAREKIRQGILDEGATLAESLRTPYEILEDRIANANRLLDLGAISWKVYGREIAAARKEFEQAQQAFSGPSLIEAGTQEFFAARDRWNALGKAAQLPQPGAGMVRQNPPESNRQSNIDKTQSKTLQELKQVAKDGFAKVASEAERTTDATTRTASAVEQLELPEVVNM